MFKNHIYFLNFLDYILSNTDINSKFQKALETECIVRKTPLAGLCPEPLPLYASSSTHFPDVGTVSVTKLSETC